MRRALAVCLTLASLGWTAPADAIPGCAEADGRGGDWFAYGGDLAGRRSQPLEDEITPGRAATLAASWAFPLALQGDTGIFNNTPVVADGCVYLLATSGWLYALNADTGDVAWKTRAGTSGQPSLAVGGGKVVAHTGGATVVALDQASGEIAWSTRVLGSGLTSSPVVFDGLVFSGMEEGSEFTSRATTNGSYAILDLATGEILRKMNVIPEDDFAAGYSGANIWTTAAVDPVTKHAYVGTAATYGHLEHPRTNAILKVDVDRFSATFGEIVAFYSGTREYYLDANRDLPCVPGVPGSNFAEGLGSCFRTDHDFGGSPALYTDAQGRTIVAEAQGSGILHAVDAATMQPVWTSMVSIPGASRVSLAADAHGLYSAEIATGELYAVDPQTGDVLWTAHSVDGFHYNPPSVANGVVYTTTTAGTLVAFDARTGLPLFDRPLHADASGPAPGLATGVAIARHTVYAVAGGAVVAYRPDPNLAALAGTVDATLPSLPGRPAVPRLEKPL